MPCQVHRSQMNFNECFVKRTFYVWPRRLAILNVISEHTIIFNIYSPWVYTRGKGETSYTVQANQFHHLLTCLNHLQGLQAFNTAKNFSDFSVEWYQFQHYFLVLECHRLKVDGNSYIHEWTTLLARDGMVWYGMVWYGMVMVGNSNVGFIWSHYLYFEECSPCVYFVNCFWEHLGTFPI